MKKQLETEIKTSHKKEQLQTVRPDAITIKHQLKQSSKHKDLAETEIEKIVKERLLRRQRAREKQYQEQPLEEILSSNPINELFNFHLNNHDKNKFKTLLVLYKCLELENENKSLTLTKEQYETWLESEENQYITTKQFEILYGLSARQQKGLRSKIEDPLPHFKFTENSNILYIRIDVEKWLENYSGKIKL